MPRFLVYTDQDTFDWLGKDGRRAWNGRWCDIAVAAHTDSTRGISMEFEDGQTMFVVLQDSYNVPPISLDVESSIDDEEGRVDVPRDMFNKFTALLKESLKDLVLSFPDGFEKRAEAWIKSYGSFTQHRYIYVTDTWTFEADIVDRN